VTTNPGFQQLMTIVCTVALTVLGQLIYFRVTRKAATEEKMPLDVSELKSKMEALEAAHKDLRQLQRDIVAVRGEVLYLKGRINGKEWKRGEA
jgi:hypothetical protein